MNPPYIDYKISSFSIYFQTFVLFIFYSLYSSELYSRNITIQSDSCDTSSITNCQISDSLSFICDSTKFHLDSIQNHIAELADSSVFTLNRKKNTLMTIGQGIFINTLVWSVDKYFLKRPYSSKGWSTLKDNLKKGFVWDCDALSTNFFDHPYHGAQYFSSARFNGFNYIHSSLFTILGSLEWEEIAETDYPAPNDLFSTVFGGSAFGEIMYRMSNIVLNNKKRGFGRFGREILATLINPTYGVNRLIYGESWKVDEEHYLYHDKHEIPYDIRLSIGSRWEKSKYSDTRCNLSSHISIDYGNWTDLRHNKPFDQFIANLAINPPAYHIPFFSEVNINARLHGWYICNKNNHKSVFSINQDFSYFNNEKEERFKGAKEHLLHLAEPSSLGPAYYYESPHIKHLTSVNLSFIGAYTSDYYYRDYNMGSGLNIKTYNHFKVNKIIDIIFDAGFHYMFTWKGYEKDQIKKFVYKGLNEPYTFSLNQSRKAGDQGYVSFFILKPRIDFLLFDNFYLTAKAQWVFRNSIYTYHDNVKSNYKELFLSLTYRIH